MEFITDYHIDFRDSFSEEFMESRMKEAIKFATCCDIRKTFYDGKHLFTCEMKGPDCFSCEFFRDNLRQGYTMIGRLPRHKKNCEKEGEEALYIKTMMLLKLRREYLEDFIQENQMLGMSPKVILLAYSRKRHNLDIPFYQSYLTQRGLVEKVKKKWANLMDSIRKSKTVVVAPSREISHHVEQREPRVDLLPFFAEDTFGSPYNSIFYPPVMLQAERDFHDKENLFFEFKFDRIVCRPPEVRPLFQMDRDTTCSAFGSLPAFLLNSSLEKDSLRDTGFPEGNR